MRWFHVRKAHIDTDLRKTFEQYGITTMQMIFSGGQWMRHLGNLIQVERASAPLLAWLTEQYDRAERKETWSITMEVAVTVLVAAELVLMLVMGSQQEARESKAFQQEQQVLSNLETSSAATARTLISLQNTSELMNSALQKQLALFYDVSVNPVYDPDKNQVAFINDGRTNVMFWGVRFQDEPPVILNEGRTIAPNAFYAFDTSRVPNVITQKLPKGTPGLFPIEIYLKNEKGEEYVQHCNFVATWSGETLKLAIHVVSIIPDRWSRTGRKTAK